MSDPLAQLTDAGVSVWLDDMSRLRLTDGSLAALISDSQLRGITTNPTIFSRAIVGSDVYDPQLDDLARRKVDVGEALRAITTQDVRGACDLLRPLYETGLPGDGRVSIEVDPRISADTDTTIAEARALWGLVDRPNLYVKIPGTRAGLPAISQCLAEGISINVTLIFSLERHRAVMAAFLDGMEGRLAAGGSLGTLASVASFFVSRVDTAVDQQLDRIATGADTVRAARARELRGEAAIANARLAYAQYEQVFSTPRWQALAAAGACPQRPLWASTGVKDPGYPDTRYVTELVGPDTVNTMPEATLRAVDDHGVVHRDTIRGGYPGPQATLHALAELGIDYDRVVEQLEHDGLATFSQAWTGLIVALERELTDRRARFAVSTPPAAGSAPRGDPGP